MTLKERNQHLQSQCTKFLRALCHLIQQPHFTDEKDKSKEMCPGQVWAQATFPLGAAGTGPGAHETFLYPGKCFKIVFKIRRKKNLGSRKCLNI